MYPPAMPIFSEPNEIIAERGCEYARSMFHNVARGTQKIGIKELPKYIAMGEQMWWKPPAWVTPLLL